MYSAVHTLKFYQEISQFPLDIDQFLQIFTNIPK